MHPGLLGAIGDASFVVDVLAGAGLGGIAGNLVVERARSRGMRVGSATTVRRWSLFGAIGAILLHLIRELPSLA